MTTPNRRTRLSKTSGCGSKAESTIESQSARKRSLLPSLYCRDMMCSSLHSLECQHRPEALEAQESCLWPDVRRSFKCAAETRFGVRPCIRDFVMAVLVKLRPDTCGL